MLVATFLSFRLFLLVLFLWLSTKTKGLGVAGDVTWISCWLFLGVAFGPAVKGLTSVKKSSRRMLSQVLVGTVFGIPAIGGLVLVGQLILDYGVCTKLQG